MNAWFDSPTRELSVNTESLNLPLWYREALCAALTSYRNDTHVAESVKLYANSVAAGAQWNTLSFLVALSQQIFQTCRQVVRPTGDPRPSDQTLNLRALRWELQ